MHYFSVDGREFYRRGRLVRVCGLAAAWYEPIENPEALIASLKQHKPKQHIFTFFQRVPHTIPRYNYYKESYPVSVITLKNYEDWWENSIKKYTRQAVKMSQKKGIIVKVSDFNDEFMEGITSIHNETPIRSGKKYPHYNVSTNSVKKREGTFIDRSIFLGAYYEKQIVGYAKLIFEEEFVDVAQLLSKMNHRDKCVTNALVAKIVEICSQREVRHIVYGDFNSTSLGDFKRHNGFLRMDLPRYFIPLNNIGAVALKLKLHHRPSEWIPDKTRPFLFYLRKRWLETFS